MMNIINKITFRYLINNKLRTIFALFSIIASIGLVIALGNLILSLNKIYKNTSISVDGDYDFKIKSSNIEIEKEIRKVENVKDYYKLKAVDTVKILNKNIDLGLDYYLGFDIVEAEDKFFRKYTMPGFLVEGEMPSRQGEILVPYDMKDVYPAFNNIGNIVELGIRPSVSKDNIGNSGDHFTINELRKIQGKEPLESFESKLNKPNNTEDIFDLYSLKKQDFNTIVDNYKSIKKYKIVGFHSSPSIETTYNPLYYSRVTRNNVNIISPMKDVIYQGDIFEYNSHIKNDYNIYGVLESYKDLRRSSDEINAQIKKYGVEADFNHQLISIKNSSLIKYGDVTSIVILSLLIFILVAVFSFIYNIFSLNFDERIKDFTTLKMIGLTNSQLWKMIFLDTILYLIICFPVSYISTKFVMKFIYNSVNNIVSESSVISNINLEWANDEKVFWIVLVSVIVVLFVVNAISTLPVLKNSSFKNYKSRRINQTTINKFKINEFFKDNVVLYNFRRTKKSIKIFNGRFIATTIGLTLFLIIVFYLIVLDSPLINSTNPHRANLVFQTNYNFSEDLKMDLDKIVGLKTKYKITQKNETLKIKKEDGEIETDSWTILSYDDEAFKTIYKSDKIYITEQNKQDKLDGKLSKNISIEKNRKIDINLLNNVKKSTNESSLTIDVEYMESKRKNYNTYAQNQKIMIMSESKFKVISKELGMDIDSSRVILGLYRQKFDKKIGYEINSIISKYPNTYQTFMPFQEYRIIKIIITAFLMVIIPILIMNIINTTYTTILNRKKEIILKLSAGIGRKELKKFIILENIIIITFISLIAFISAIILTTMTYIFIDSQISISLFRIMLNLFWKIILIWIFTTIIIYIVIYISIVIPYDKIVKNALNKF